MYSIWGKKSKEAEAEKKKPRTTAAQIRVQKDLAELDIPDTIQLDFPDPSNILNFNISIHPDEGFYKGGVFKFTFSISNNYPHEPPKVLCIQKIYHPNIDLEGNICLNILREDWKPVLSLQAVLVGLQYLFLEPNADDPLNKVAAEVLRDNRRLFENNHSTLYDLNTRLWNNNRTILDLAYLLGHQSIIDLLIKRGLSNEFNTLKKTEQQYFRKGLVKENKKKVLLTGEQQQQGKRQQIEVAQLVKRSAVKNNPLYRKLEKVSTINKHTPPPCLTEDESSSEEELQFYGNSIQNTSKENSLDSSDSDDDDETVEHKAITVFRALRPVYKATLFNKEEETANDPTSSTTLVENCYLNNNRMPRKIDDENRRREIKRQSGSQKAAWTMSISSWAAMLDREFNLNGLNSLTEESTIPLKLDNGDLKLNNGSKDNSTSSQMENTIPKRESSMPTEHHKDVFSAGPSQKKVTRHEKEIRSTMVHSIPPHLLKQGYGRLYLHINSIQDILLPLPKDRTFIRCVISDGQFEYMSRYEVLSQNIHFDHECVIDTHPDMIITLSLHVRPDYMIKPRKPLSRLFTSRKKKKESLSGYVNKEDGAIGQAQFALADMVSACTEIDYEAGFSCFNAWYSKSFKERHRQKKKDQDVLKVVGNFNLDDL
ncbi:hypothetical protein RO3G_15307 [Rhizopus delemar RA 99-880]|uniref:NEDD8-conjugating enzyme UBC12 n=1 Tax=Rhizopus delemar (strain RA 99-880 / ATCC MYA-4621 / FGSC 9543 / NRRL 43880) TaxID=246409 RepID=I1CQ66_RHIO9|nr:hypothetical protein RO3G_15307 [Rhizopus delemar RA 99-880]|eukprot:EIE90596.1 hypothetical protein RO3G_15307 [Rhizopus delemar RA 99-880]